MKSRFAITISDINGSRHYNFSQFVRKFFVVFLLFVILVAVAGGYTILWLTGEVVVVNSKMRIVQNDYESILAETKRVHHETLLEKVNLEKSLHEKSKEISNLDSTLRGIENIIGLKQQDDLPILQRASLSEISSLEKKAFMQIIPSGMPIKTKTRITSPFGKRKHPIFKHVHIHKGLDFSGEKTTKIFAVADGVVTFAKYSSGGFGKLVSLKHAFGFKTTYGHLSKIAVKYGDVVKRGDLLGYVGSTGQSTGNHLHYEIRYLDKAINPYYFAKWDIKNYKESITALQKHNPLIPWDSIENIVSLRIRTIEKQLNNKHTPVVAATEAVDNSSIDNLVN